MKYGKASKRLKMTDSYLPLFNSKILLFGEYSLMYGSMALSIPFECFHGQLILPGALPQNDDAIFSNLQIKQFLSHLRMLNDEKKLDFTIDIDRFSDDVEAGLYFKSNIPQGYGLGSSGALVASIFSAYGEHPKNHFTDTAKLLQLKSFFSIVESYFHGKSSGLDPLISYLNQAVLISGKDRIETIYQKGNSTNGRGAVFLIDSGSSGETEPLVNHFIENYTNADYKYTIDHELIPLVNKAVKYYIDGNFEMLLATLKQISFLQMNVFDFMIPKSVRGVWQVGLETNAYYLKLCGSGGGGMMLGFTADIQVSLNHLAPFKPIIIHRL